MINRLRTATQQAQKANEELKSAVLAAFPIGSPVWWVKTGKTVQAGTILEHGKKCGVKVHNIRTGVKYWIGSYHILKAYDIGEE